MFGQYVIEVNLFCISVETMWELLIYTWLIVCIKHCCSWINDTLINPRLYLFSISGTRNTIGTAKKQFDYVLQVKQHISNVRYYNNESIKYDSHSPPFQLLRLIDGYFLSFFIRHLPIFGVMRIFSQFIVPSLVEFLFSPLRQDNGTVGIAIKYSMISIYLNKNQIVARQT